MKSARLPAYKDLSGFDFAASDINEPAVRTLHRCEFMDGAQNVVLIHCPSGHCMAMSREGADPGTGKTQVATALLDRLTHRCHILEAGNDSFRFNASSAAAARQKKETNYILTPA